MHLIHVNSSNVAAIGYDADIQTLRVEFKVKDGTKSSVYDYFCVTEEEFDLVQNAMSVGKALAEHIKGKKTFLKIEEVELP